MKRDKTNKKCKRLQLQEEIRDITISYFPRKKNKLWSNWNFQNNYWDFMIDIFLIIFKPEINSQDRFQKLAPPTKWIWLLIE